MLSNPATRREYPPEAAYFLGEAYRLRNEAGAADRTYVEYYLSLMDSAAPADNNLPKAE